MRRGEHRRRNLWALAEICGQGRELVGGRKGGQTWKGRSLWGCIGRRIDLEGSKQRDKSLGSVAFDTDCWCLVFNSSRRVMLKLTFRWRWRWLAPELLIAG